MGWAMIVSFTDLNTGKEDTPRFVRLRADLIESVQGPYEQHGINYHQIRLTNGNYFNVRETGEQITKKWLEALQMPRKRFPKIQDPSP